MSGWQEGDTVEAAFEGEWYTAEVVGHERGGVLVRWDDGTHSVVGREAVRGRVFPKMFVAAGTVTVREGEGMGTDVVQAEIERSDVVVVEEVRGNRARLSAPVCGWCSVVSRSGDTLLHECMPKQTRLDELLVPTPSPAQSLHRRPWRSASPSPPPNCPYPSPKHKTSTWDHRRTDKLHAKHEERLCRLAAAQDMKKTLQAEHDAQHNTFKPTITQSSWSGGRGDVVARLYRVKKSLEEPDNEAVKRECTFKPKINELRGFSSEGGVAAGLRLYGGAKKKDVELKKVNEEKAARERSFCVVKKSQYKDRGEFFTKLAKEVERPEPTYPFKPTISKRSSQLAAAKRSRNHSQSTHLPTPPTDSPPPSADEWSGSEADNFTPPLTLSPPLIPHPLHPPPPTPGVPSTVLMKYMSSLCVTPFVL